MNKKGECYKIAFDNAGINNRQLFEHNDNNKNENENNDYNDEDVEMNTLDKIGQNTRENTNNKNTGQVNEKTSFKTYFI